MKVIFNDSMHKHCVYKELFQTGTEKYLKRRRKTIHLELASYWKEVGNNQTRKYVVNQTV